jgi:hypothetical protein
LLQERDINFWYEYDLKWLDKCDAVFMLPNWCESNGAKLEQNYALKKGKIGIFDLDDAKKWADMWQLKK